MKKFNWGTISNPETGKSKDIEVKPTAIFSYWKDLLLGSGLIIAGVSLLVKKAFNNGAIEYETAEYNVMEDLGLFSNGEMKDYHRE